MATSNTAAFTLAAAHGITPRVIATWQTDLPRTPRVLVPVQLDALVIRPQAAAAEIFADCKMNAAAPGTKATRKSLLPPPFQDRETRPPGVYLHWALPDALTHGDTASDSVKFPAIPDRWLVVRVGPSAVGTTRRGIAAWVLRAADPNPTPIDLDKWKETGNLPDAAANPPTAMGYGDPAWAAYFDNVVNRLGFYDPLEKVTTGPLAYLVCGWYSDPSLDPLGVKEVHSLSEFDGRMAGLGWELRPGELHEAVNRFSQYVTAATMVGLQTREAVSVGSFAATAVKGTARASTSFLPPSPSATVGPPPAALDPNGRPVDGAYTTNGSWWPELTLYHGSIVAIGWPGIGWPGNENGLLSGEVGGPPPASNIKVGIGNTSGEALARLVANANAAPDETRVLEAFLLGGLRDLDQPDGAARVDSLLHASEFASRDTGFTEEDIPQQAMPPGTPPLPPQPVTPDGPGIFKRPASVATGVRDVIAVNDAAVTAISGIGATTAHNAERFSENFVLSGSLAEAVTAVVQPPPAVVTPAKTVTVKRALPRLFQPADPVILLQGGQRTYKHGADGRFSEDGRLLCRLTGFCVTELSSLAIFGEVIRPAMRGADFLDRGLENGGIPPECEDLLQETVLLDPGSSIAAANAWAVSPIRAASRAGAANVPLLERNFRVEQTAWWAVRDPRIDPGPLLARSGITGMLPSPIAVTPPVRPWNPIHLDWAVQFIPSANGVKDWELGEIDFDPGSQPLPSTEDTKSGILMQGRAHLTAGAAGTVAHSIRVALAQAASAAGTDPLPAKIRIRYHSVMAQTLLTNIQNVVAASVVSGGGGDGVPAIDRSALADIASTLENMDVLSGAFDGFHDGLRGGYTGDGTTVPPPDSPAPSPFIPLRSGFLRILRLRLVDGFGQVVDLAGSSETKLVDSSQIVKSEPMEVTDQPAFELLPPRFTSPARLMFRYIAADGTPQEAGATVSPVCGFMLPNHLDGDLEFFDAAGSGLGTVRPDPVGGIVWEDAPGITSTVGQTPARAISNSFAAGIAQGLIDWGLVDATAAESREDALSALLRIIDSTLWTVDPFGHTGDEHLSLLIGHPVAVMRARLKLEVREPIAPADVSRIRVPVRLGALAHWQDGLLGYFVNDDYTTLYCADAAAAGFAREVGPNRGFLQQANLVPDFYQKFSDDLGANATEGQSPVNHPYVDDSGVVWIQPNQEVLLTLLVEPHGVVHATSGLLPRKEIGMRREWVAAGLAQIAPTFRFGPVLVDPQRIRMPIATELQGSWSWDHRADVSHWLEDPVVNDTGDALLPPDPARGTEGWLKLGPPKAAQA